MEVCRYRSAVSRLFFGAVLAGFVASPAWAQSPILMKLGTATLNDAQHEFLKRFAAAVEKDSGGRIKAEVYPASQLGPIPREIEAVQLGAVQGFVSPAEFLEGVDPRFQVLSAPGIFKDMNHVDRVTKDAEFRKAYFEVGAQRGLRVSAVFLSGPTAVNTRKPVHHIDEIKGLKLRVLASPMQMEPVKALGATPVPLSLGDVLPALQQGAIDGVMSVLPVLSAMHYYDTAKYISETNLSYAVSTFVMSRTWFSHLPADLQKIVSDDAARVGDGMQPWAVDFYYAQRKAWNAAGGEVIAISDEERAKVSAPLVAVAARVAASKPAVEAMYKVLEAAAKRTQ